jgi:hypothetical protein
MSHSGDSVAEVPVESCEVVELHLIPTCDRVLVFPYQILYRRLYLKHMADDTNRTKNDTNRMENDTMPYRRLHLVCTAGERKTYVLNAGYTLYG